jgi:hypothetical protein
MGEVHVESLCSRFDTSWYLYSNPDVEEAGWDAFIDYMIVGWRENRDPSPHFSTNAYLVRYPDIQASKSIRSSTGSFTDLPRDDRVLHPAVTSETDLIARRSLQSSLTAKRSRWTPACITAVLRQTYQDLAVMIVGLPLSCPCQSIFDNFAKGEEGKKLHRPNRRSRMVLLALGQMCSGADGDRLAMGRARPGGARRRLP